MAAEAGVFVHPRGINESETVGAGTRIWAFAHVMKGAVIGSDCNIGDHAFVESGAIVGDAVTIKNGVSVWSGVTLEKFTFVGPNVAFTNDRFPRSPRMEIVREHYQKMQWLEKTLVREGATLGANATLLCGLSVGRFAMVAAGAVVIRDVGDFELVAGCPAKPIGYVCMCGKPLRKKAARLVCAGCERSYQKKGKAVALASGSRAAK